MSKSRIVVLSVSTDPSVGADNFVKSLDHFGWEYYILGRGQAFHGWPWRTRMYINTIHQLMRKSTDIFILCDSNDLFFVGGPEEAERKFTKQALELGIRVAVGAEPACCNGYYMDRSRRPRAIDRMRDLGRKSQVRDLGKDNTRYAFPNGGFSIGYANDLLSLLEANKDEGDDQGGLLQKLMDDGSRFHLDRRQAFVGNLPNMTYFYRMDYDADVPEENHWVFKDNRWANIHSGETPIALHFPGHYWRGYDHMASKIFTTQKIFGSGNPATFVVRKDIEIKTLNVIPSMSTTQTYVLVTIGCLAVLLGIVGLSYSIVSITRGNKQNKPQVWTDI